MAKFGDILSPSELPYPSGDAAQKAACGNGPYAPPERDGFFNRLFAPKELTYPLPACPIDSRRERGALAPTAESGSAVILPPGISAPSAPAFPSGDSGFALVLVPYVAGSGYAVPPSGLAQAAAPVPASVPAAAPAAATPAAATPAAAAPAVSPPPAAAPAAATPAVSPPPAAAPAVAAPATSSGSPSPASPDDGSKSMISTPILAPTPLIRTQCPKMLRAHSFNPEFSPRIPTAQEAYIAEELDEEIPAGMITKDTTPVVFVVPDGCDSMDLLFSPIEVNPGCGCDSDLDEIVTVGEAKLSANVRDLDAQLRPGDQVIVTVPWRAASWVDLPAGRLRMTVIASFYNASDSNT
jgi:hypothetical protein